jgi:hypothetical protein
VEGSRAMLLLCVFGMIIRSAFRLDDIRFSPSSDSMIVKKVSDFKYRAVMLNKEVSPSVLLYADSVDARPSWFLHYNYTIFECIWSTHTVSVDEKIKVFKDMASWLQAYNHTLRGEFNTNDDFLAWSIAQIADEFHFD